MLHRYGTCFCDNLFEVYFPHSYQNYPLKNIHQNMLILLSKPFNGFSSVRIKFKEDLVLKEDFLGSVLSPQLSFTLSMFHPPSGLSSLEPKYKVFPHLRQEIVGNALPPDSHRDHSLISFKALLKCLLHTVAFPNPFPITL